MIKPTWTPDINTKGPPSHTHTHTAPQQTTDGHLNGAPDGAPDNLPDRPQMDSNGHLRDFNDPLNPDGLLTDF